MAKCIILSGIPCSGKSTFVKEQKSIIISCDVIRDEIFGKDYIFDYRKERRVWETFYYMLSVLSKQDKDIIIDNTNCKLAYINQIREVLGDSWNYEIKRFDCPLWIAYLRNIIRRIKTGKHIPFKVIKAMKRNYDILWA